VALDEANDDLLVGYGTWTHVESFGTEPANRHLEIEWFGLDERYKGRTDEAGIKVADQLYSVVEQRALADPLTTPNMPFTLVCHIDNVRGRRFWERLGYRLVGPPYPEVEDERYYRMVR
jgi:hypothetical protein